MKKTLTILKESVLVSRLSLLGTHDSCTHAVRFPHKITSRCVSDDISEQLENEIRYLDIRLNLIKGDLMAYHGLANCHITWNEIQDRLRSFLKNNSGEIVFLRILRADDTFKTGVADDVWDEAYSKLTDHSLVSECYADTTIEALRGKAVCINYKFRKMFPYTTNEDYTLRATRKDLVTKMENIHRQMGRKEEGKLNLITFNARGSLPLLTCIPYPERFAKQLARHLSWEPGGSSPLWGCFDFPEKFPDLLKRDILRRNQCFEKGNA